MDSDYQPDWTYYLSTVNEKIGSISTDLNLSTIAPMQGQEYVVLVSIKMLNPLENGLSNKEDSEELWAIEDKIIEALQKSKMPFTFAGRLTTDGLRDFYIYGDDTALLEKHITAAMVSFPTYDFTLENKKDEAWSSYFDFLYPLPIQMEVIQNRRVVEQLEKGGDDLTRAREVIHYIYFKTQNELDQYEIFVNELGFKTLNKGNTESSSEYEFFISISRIDKVDYDEINTYPLELWEKASELNGEYDGWETTIEN